LWCEIIDAPLSDETPWPKAASLVRQGVVFLTFHSLRPDRRPLIGILAWKNNGTDTKEYAKLRTLNSIMLL